MSRGCCGGSSAPKITQGRHISTQGSGSTQDPVTISATTELSIQSNDTFDLSLTGNGNLESPWMLEVFFASTSSVSDLADFEAPEDTPNGYVAAWDRTNGQWHPAPPSVAAPGSVAAGNGITGDGSAPNPLTVKRDTTRYLQVTVNGIGLTDAGINRLVRTFPTAAARAAASPAPDITAVSILETAPDQLDYWDGSQWEPITGGYRRDIQPGQFMALSGDYAGGAITTYVAQLEATTDATGAFEVITADDLAGYAGVLAVTVQETGSEVWHCQPDAGTGNVIGIAYSVADGLPLTATTLTGVVTAVLY